MSVPWYLMAKGKGGGYKTASGPIVSISNALAAPLRSLLVNIDPVQEGTGDPSPDNVRPISGWSAVNAWRTGKNLMNQTDFVQGSIIGMGVDTASTTRLRSPAIRVSPLTTYSAATNSNLIVYEFHEYDVNGTWVGLKSISATSGTITTKTNTVWMKVLVRKSNNNTIEVSELTSFQLEHNNEPTPYEPYSGNQYTIQLGDTYYGGTLDVTNGVLTVDRAEVDLGTLEWQKTDNHFYANDLRSVIKAPADNYTKANVLCSQYETAPLSVVYSETKDCAIAVQTTPDSALGTIHLNNSAYASSTATAFKTAMSGVQLVYELDTPITIPLTPQEISTLQGQNNVWVDSGDITIEYLASGGVNADLMKLAVAFMGRK